MTNLFLIVYNETTLTKAELVSLFDKMPGVSTWFSQFPGSFFVKTSDSFTTKTISELIIEKASTVTHVVVKVHNKKIEDYWGLWGKDLWEHFT